MTHFRSWGQNSKKYFNFWFKKSLVSKLTDLYLCTYVSHNSNNPYKYPALLRLGTLLFFFQNFVNSVGWILLTFLNNSLVICGSANDTNNKWAGHRMFSQKTNSEFLSKYWDEQLIWVYRCNKITKTWIRNSFFVKTCDEPHIWL